MPNGRLYYSLICYAVAINPHENCWYIMSQINYIMHISFCQLQGFLLVLCWCSRKCVRPNTSTLQLLVVSLWDSLRMFIIRGKLYVWCDSMLRVDAHMLTYNGFLFTNYDFDGELMGRIPHLLISIQISIVSHNSI